MKFKKLLKYIGFLIAIVPFAGAACSGHSEADYTLRVTPKYLLIGTQEATSGDFVYYSINGDTEYAVALKESAKSSSSQITIPAEYNEKPVTGIWRYGFADSNATSILIPSGITVIDFEAFMNSKIKSVTIPATIDEIGEAAFYACKDLTKASIQNTTTTSEASSACSCSEVEGEGEEERIPCSLTTIPSFCFFNCHALKELVLPQSIEEIEYEAFSNCRSLYSTLAFMNIKAIRSRAFQGCVSLKSVYISSSFFAKDLETNLPVGVIEDKAFDRCNTSLKFWLVGDTADVQDWLDRHTDNKWRWKNETTDHSSSSNLYTYEITASGASYTNDWIFTTVNGDVEISSYIGPTEIEGTPVKFLSVPNELPSGSGNKVRKISIDAFNTVKANLERLYLPKTLKRIEANMFNGDYDKLIVVDDNTKCLSDESTIAGGETLSARIVLNGLTELEVIGNKAFVNMDKLNTVKTLKLPYSLKAVGVRAFGTTETDGKHLKALTVFEWDYDDAKSALKVIGREAFFKMGNNENSKSTTNGIHKYYLNNNGTTNYTLTTLVLPRTLEHFGITPTDNSTYALGGEEGNDNNFGIYAFTGCPLLEKVIFKGSAKSKVQAGANSDSDTFNLFLPSYSFTMNESLRTVVFEERCGKTILFHTGNTDHPVIGWSAGRSKNDFGGDPSVQEIFLPNRYTTLRMARYTFQGNSRGAVYLSGAEGANIYGHKTDANYIRTYMDNPSKNSVAITEIVDWYQVGIENTYGYHFDPNATQNHYGLEQNMPLYYNVHYEKAINETYASTETFIGVGPTNSANEYVIKDKCAFVCGASTATMSNYLYDRHDSNFTGTAKVPATVDRPGGGTCTVNAIGDSAFSAAFCDTSSYKNYSNYKDLTAVSIPDTITKIGEYAFMRAYGVTNLYSYNPSTDASNGDYVMPSGLTEIGRQAFAFCNIKKFLKIPTNCTFYETTNSVSSSGYTTSVFSNNFSLRKITFGNNATSSTYYTTTTYAASNLETYTSAIYSTSAVSKNKSSLLLVLNRDNADYLATSDDVRSVQETIGNSTVDCSEFNGRYANGYLYGAFKMCYWIDSLVVGKTNQSSKNQPLISGVYNVSGNKDEYLYLANKYDFTGNIANLKVISFGNATSIETPPYSFEGCEQLSKVRLPRIVGGSIPAGLFAYAENEDIVFEVPSDTTGTNFTACNPGELDLTFTGYTSIDAEAFKGTGIKKLTAPITTDFTIQADAFGDCTSLTKIDFSKVTGSVNLNASFRGSSINNDLFEYGSSALIRFNDECFTNCTFPGKTFTFPAKTAIIGNSCFENCSTLENVTAEANLTELERVVVDNGDGLNNAGNDTGFKQIGNYAFNMCTNLKNFDFGKFPDLERIGHFAFGMKAVSGSTIAYEAEGSKNNNASICPGGVVVLPASLTNIGVGAFHTSKVVSVTFKSHSIKFERANKFTSDIRLRTNNNHGGAQFRYCYSLTTVFFEDPDCAWTTPYMLKSEGGQDNYFSNCTSLTVLVMPRGYDIQCPRYTGTTDSTRCDSMVWESSKSLKVYVWHTVNDLDSNKPAISDFWHRMAANDNAPIVFNCNSNADIVKQEGGSYVEIKQGTVYWTLVDGAIVYLGTASVNSSTGVVTFSVPGNYTADSTGIHHS